MQRNRTVILLAAGKSSRMGTCKACLKLPDGSTFAEHIIRRYADFGCDQFIIVLNKSSKDCISKSSIRSLPGFMEILNNSPDACRNRSIQLGLKKGKPGNYIFIHNVDQPLIDDAVLEDIFAHRSNTSWVKPEYLGKGGHPILLGPEIAKLISELSWKDEPFHRTLAAYNSITVRVRSKSILLNINSQEDYNNLLKSEIQYRGK